MGLPTLQKKKTNYEHVKYSASMFVWILWISFLVLSCQSKPDYNIPHETLHLSENKIYRLHEPDATFILPNILEEISGLSYHKKKDYLLAVQDELGILFLLDPQTGHIIDQLRFGPRGDYEGVAVHGDTAWVLRSDGTLFKVTDFFSGNRHTTKITTPLKSANDAEGICLDEHTNSLLIALKGKPFVDNKRLTALKAIYRYDLIKQDFITEPAFLIHGDSVAVYKDYNWFEHFSIQFAKRLHLIDPDFQFKPSGIAINPLNDKIFIIAHVGKTLIVMSRYGEIEQIQSLSPRLFRQPEGICFAPDGTLFIANEARGGKPKILRFDLYDDVPTISNSIN